MTYVVLITSRYILEQLCHLLLSVSLKCVVTNGDLLDVVGDFPLAGLAEDQLWLTDDLEFVIASKTVSPQLRSSENAKLVVKEGPIFTKCTYLIINIES